MILIGILVFQKAYNSGFSTHQEPLPQIEVYMSATIIFPSFIILDHIKLSLLVS